MEPSSSSRNAKNYFLTYPRCPLSKEDVPEEGGFVEDGVFRPDGRKRKRNSAHVDDHYRRALKASTKEEALNIIRENDPKTFFRRYHRLSANMDIIFAPANEGYSSQFDPQSFIIPEELLLWAKENVGPTRPDRPKSLILEGPTRIGKTEWARSLGPHNYNSCCMDFSSRTFSNDVWYNVIDNVAPSYLIKKHWKELLGAKQDWQANVRYGKPVQIKGGIPSIVLCNPDSSYKAFLEKEKNRALKDWTIVNAEFFFADAPLYRSSASSQEAEEASNYQNYGCI